MKIDSIKIKNVKSFKNECLIHFESGLNILIGPNGGGKSNLLEILTITIRHFFFKNYNINEGVDRDQKFNNIDAGEIFNPIANYLDKYTGDNSDSEIEISIYVSIEDLDNMEVFIENKDNFITSIGNYRNVPIRNFDFLDNWNLENVHPGDILTYRIINNQIQNSAGFERYYLEYLNHFDYFNILSSHINGLTINYTYLYFPPHRAFDINSLTTTLHNEKLANLIYQYISATASSNSSLIKLGTNYFASKMRSFEVEGGDIIRKFQNDSEVKAITKYLEDLGYKWDLICQDFNENRYQIRLKNGDFIFNLLQASSGEKQLINFLLGIFAFTIKNGLISIDEPELHLHPKWQNLLINLFTEISADRGNQFILSTHSSVFIKDNTINNIRRVFKNNHNSSEVITGNPDSIDDIPGLLHVINSHNNEKIFFSDIVVLVEGPKDRIIFEKLINSYAEYSRVTKVIEVLEVHGKSHFKRYSLLLKELKVKSYIIADNDYVNTIGPNDSDIEDLFDDSHKLREDLNDGEVNKLNRFFEKLNRKGIFILRLGNIEQYLPYRGKSIEKAVEFTNNQNFTSWLTTSRDHEGKIEIDKYVFKILSIRNNRRSRIIDLLTENS